MSDRAQVALVNMPFSFSKYPSIQLGTLSALLKSKGVQRRLSSPQCAFRPQDWGAPLRIDL